MLLLESLLDVRTKNASNLSDEEWLQLMQYDPLISTIGDLSIETMNNTTESYSRWLVKMNKTGQLNQYKPEQIKQILSNFTKLKNKRNVLPNNDINYYQTIDELMTVVNDNINKMSVRQQNRQAHKDKKNIENADKPGKYLDDSVELLFNGSEWQVWTPLTFQGSKALRRGAVWCTGGDDSYYYNSYTRNGKLFIIINKQDPKEKYQLFVPFDKNDTEYSKEFKDKNNNTPTTFRGFIHKNPELLNFFLTVKEVTNAYDNLSDKSIQDELTLEEEEVIMSNYSLDYDDNGVITMEVPLTKIILETYWTNKYDYYTCRGSYFDDMYDTLNNLEEQIEDDKIESDISGFKKAVTETNEFIKEINWKNTTLKRLYTYYLEDNHKTEDDITFEEFLITLFQRENNTNMNFELYKWFADRAGDNWYTEMMDRITPNALVEPLLIYIINAVDRLAVDGFNIDQYSSNWFVWESGYHAIADFWKEITDYGQKTDIEVLDSIYIPVVKEQLGDIKPENANFNRYNEEYAEDDATDIAELFMYLD